jgi:hypothetical protein
LTAPAAGPGETGVAEAAEVSSEDERRGSTPLPAVLTVPLLGQLLAQLPSLERTELICRWATDDDLGTRLTLARALYIPTPMNGARWVLEHLCHDDDATVRAAAERTLHLRKRPR